MTASVKPLLHEAPADLQQRNSLRLPARASILWRVQSPEQLAALLTGPDMNAESLLVLGGGSNLVLPPELPGPVLQYVDDSIDWLPAEADRQRVRVSAGANWHGLVCTLAEQGWWGLERLALIPGSVGAAPVQNIGAYGQELADCCTAVQVWDRRLARLEWLPAAACRFGYRDSCFRRQRERWIVVTVELALWRKPASVVAPAYPGVQETLAAMGLAGRTPLDFVQAIIQLRRQKLPDPEQIPNAGSFFKNPVIPVAEAQRLQAQWPELPVHGQGAVAKLSAAWLIEQSGWRGRSLGPVAMSAQHALVMVNRGGAEQRHVCALAQQVRNAVQERFGIMLEIEPIVVDGRADPGPPAAGDPGSADSGV